MTESKQYGQTAFWLAVAMTVAHHSALGQSITVRLVNARSGKPLKGQNVTISWCPDCFSQTVVSVNEEGVGRVAIPIGANNFFIRGGPKPGKEPYRIAYIDCNDVSQRAIPINEVMKQGLVPHNTCGKRNAAPVAGQIIFWALPRPWWQMDFQ